MAAIEISESPHAGGRHGTDLCKVRIAISMNFSLLKLKQLLQNWISNHMVYILHPLLKWSKCVQQISQLAGLLWGL